MNPCANRTCTDDAERRGYCRACYRRLMGAGELALVRSVRRWTTSEIAQMRRWHREGRTKAYMAAQLVATLDQVKQVSSRLGMRLPTKVLASRLATIIRNVDTLPPQSEGDRCACGLTRDKDHRTCDMGDVRQGLRERKGDEGLAAVGVRSKLA